MSFELRKGGGKTMVNVAITEDLKEYYLRLIALMSVTVPWKYQLSKVQRDFLAECCVLKQQGVEISNMAALARHFLNNNILNDRQQISNRKTALGSKKWAETGHNIFNLPYPLTEPPSKTYKDSFSVQITFDGES